MVCVKRHGKGGKTDTQSVIRIRELAFKRQISCEDGTCSFDWIERGPCLQLAAILRTACLAVKNGKSLREGNF